MKTSELIGNALCYAVTTIEMPHLVWGETIGMHHASDQIVVPELKSPQCYSPYTDWDMCGPLIEQYRIQVTPHSHAWHAVMVHTEQKMVVSQYGPTPLIAAMRCLVASRLGDEVEIPEELAP